MGAWRIVKDLNYPLHKSLNGFSVLEYPYTITFVIKRRMQIDSYMELPEEKRPPRSIWDYPSKISEWFDNAFSDGKKQNEFTLPVNDDEVE
jgi:hypothetical protein